MPLYREAQVFRPPRRAGQPLGVCGLDGRRLLPRRSRRRAHGPDPEAVRQAVHGRDHGPGSRPGAWPHEDRLPLGACARRSIVERGRSAGCRLPLCAGARWRACRAFSSTASRASLQVDGYGGYRRLARAERKGGAPLTLAFCWSHGRRERDHQGDAEGRLAGGGRPSSRGSQNSTGSRRPSGGSDAGKRRLVRQEASRPLIDETRRLPARAGAAACRRKEPRWAGAVAYLLNQLGRAVRL